MTDSTLIFTTSPASSWHKFSLYMTEYIERRVGVPTIFLHGGLLDDFATGDADAGFIDILSYLRLWQQSPNPVELIAVPVMQDGSEDDIFASFFDIVVREESPLDVPDDLEGRTWAYYGGTSHVEDDFLCQQRIPALGFSKVLEASSPAHALRYVLDGKADATSIDARTFDMVLRNSPCMAARLRILGSGCHTPLPLIVVAAQLDTLLKQRIQDTFLNIHKEPFFSSWLHDEGIERFVLATNSCYQEDARTWHERAQHTPVTLPMRGRSVEMPAAVLAQHCSFSF